MKKDCTRTRTDSAGKAIDLYKLPAVSPLPLDWQACWQVVFTLRATGCPLPAMYTRREILPLPYHFY
jgi:hypothetical protein